MRNYWTLAKLQLSSLFGINRMRHSTDEAAVKKNRRGILLLVVLVVCFGNISVTYGSAMLSIMDAAGAPTATLGLMAIGASALTLMMTLFQVRGVLFSFGDYDTLMSWPVSVRAVAAARMTTLYVYNLFYSVLLLVPALVLISIRAAASGTPYPLYAYPMMLLLTLAVPVLPMAAGCVLGTAVTAVTVRMKHRNFANILAQFVLFGGIMAASFSTSGLMTKLASIPGTEIRASIERLYAPAALYYQGASGDAWCSLVFLMVNVLVAAALIVGFAMLFKPLSTALAANRRPKADFRLRASGRQSRLSALYGKELKRYFASSAYVLNTAMGTVLLLAAAVALLIKKDLVSSFLADSGIAGLRGALPLALGFFVVLSGTTSSSVSMEGKSLWIVKSLPLPAREVFLSKILVSLTVILPGLLLFCPICALSLGLAGWDLFFLFVTPLCYAFFTAVLGLAVNLRFPKLDWKNDVEVVKQSTATMIMTFGGMLLTFAPVGVMLATGWYGVLPVFTALLALGAFLSWRALSRKGGALLLGL